ncbi:MAG TPA: hypothetical protein VHQ45_14780, partial [Gemmatimonadaceae bacterium]|nr:hypothetical protein [Gemmatimonadaceae bacterium]
TVLTITVVGQATDARLTDVASAIPYRATVAGVPRGHYTARLVHRYVGASWPTLTVLNQRIEIR